MKRPRGFSLVELMAVVALVGVIASLAVMSIKRSRSSDDADKWANLLRNTVNQVRRRAISTGSTYMIDLRANPNRLQWCQVVDTIGSCTTTTTTCPNSGTGMENSVPQASGTDGLLDVCTFKEGSLWYGLLYLSGMVLGQHEEMEDFMRVRTRRLRVEAAGAAPYQIDGDPGGALPVEISVLPRRLTMLVARSWADGQGFAAAAAQQMM